MILLFDADTLEFTGTYFELPVSLHKRGAPWVAVDGEKGVAYTGDSRNYTEIYEWKLDDFSYICTVELSDEVKKIQGGDCMDGILYVGTNDMTRSCHAINPQNGTAVKLFDRITYEYKLIDNFGGEGEDITVLPMEDGSFIHSLTIGAGFTDAWVKSYG